MKHACDVCVQMMYVSMLLELVQHESTQGLVPRNFKLVPGQDDAIWLVVSAGVSV